MTEIVWDAITKPETLSVEALAERHAFADAARTYDWKKVEQLLEKNGALINTTRPGGTARYTVLHQAAHGGAPPAVVEQLIARGAWRTMRNAQGERPVDVARAQGHEHLLGLLEPACGRKVSASDLAAMQRHFHDVILALVGDLVQAQALRLPDLDFLLEVSEPFFRCPIPGMYGGFTGRLAEVDTSPVLVVTSWCRIVGGSGKRHVISPFGSVLVAHGFV